MGSWQQLFLSYDCEALQMLLQFLAGALAFANMTSAKGNNSERRKKAVAKLTALMHTHKVPVPVKLFQN